MCLFRILVKYINKKFHVTTEQATNSLIKVILINTLLPMLLVSFCSYLSNFRHTNFKIWIPIIQTLYCEDPWLYFEPKRNP